MGELDAAAQQFQILLEAGDASSPLLSLAYTALGKIYYAQERLLPAAAEYESALDAFPANAEAQALLGDIALRNGDAAAALQAYDAAFDLLPAYSRYFPPDPRHADGFFVYPSRPGAGQHGQADEAAASATGLWRRRRSSPHASRTRPQATSPSPSPTRREASGASRRAYEAALECDRSVEPPSPASGGAGETRPDVASLPLRLSVIMGGNRFIPPGANGCRRQVHLARKSAMRLKCLGCEALARLLTLGGAVAAHRRRRAVQARPAQPPQRSRDRLQSASTPRPPTNTTPSCWAMASAARLPSASCRQACP